MRISCFVKLLDFSFSFILFFHLQVEEIVPVGSLDPNHIHVAGIYVQKILQGKSYRKPIEVTFFTNF
jgi:hypothetical protein